MKEAYLPVYDAKQFDREKDGPKTISLLVLTRDPQVIGTIKDAGRTLGEDPAPEKALDYLLKNRNRLYVRRDVEGMIRSGLDSLGSEEQKELTKGNATLAPDFLTLEEGKTPSALKGAGLLTLGILLLVGQFFYYIGLRRR